MTTTLWIVLVAGSFVAGAAIVAALVVVRAQEAFAALMGVLGFIACAWAFGRLGSEYARADVLAYALGLALGGLGGGYALSSALLEHLAPRQATPTVELGEDSGKTRIVILSCIEPASYDPRETSLELHSLAEEGLVDLTIGVTPFMYAAQKARYRAVGGASPSLEQALRLAESLESRIDTRNIDAVTVASCGGSMSLPSRVAEAAKSGCRRVLVVPVGVGESAEMARAKRLVDQMRVAESGISLVYARPPWNSDLVLTALTDRILAAVSTPATTGVALVARGQPETREKSYSSFDADEAAYVSRARMLLADGGIDQSHVLVAWAEWREPDVASTVRHLAALGCSRILVAPACLPFDSLVTRLDVPIGIRQSRVDASTSVVTLNAWNDDPRVVDALAEVVLEAERETVADGEAR